MASRPRSRSLLGRVARRVATWSRSNRQPASSLRTPPLEDLAAALRGHPLPEPVRFLPPPPVRLVRPLHSALLDPRMHRPKVGRAPASYRCGHDQVKPPAVRLVHCSPLFPVVPRAMVSAPGRRFRGPGLSGPRAGPAPLRLRGRGHVVLAGFLPVRTLAPELSTVVDKCVYNSAA